MDDLVPQEVVVGGHRLDLLIPADAEALIDEQAFEHDEFMPYWAELWPSGMALAETVAAAPPAGRALELGCGLGLPSLVAALGGTDVLATDWALDAVTLLGRNAARCGAPLRHLRWSWTQDAAVLGDPFELVLAADVLYERRNGPQLLAVLDAVVGPGGEAWIADPDRPAAPEFFAAARKHWDVEELDRSAGVPVRRLRRR